MTEPATVSGERKLARIGIRYSQITSHREIGPADETRKVFGFGAARLPLAVRRGGLGFDSVQHARRIDEGGTSVHRDGNSERLGDFFPTCAGL